MKILGTCGCGCGSATYSKFAVGHDSRFVSAKIALTVQTNADPDAVAMEIERVGSPALAAKFRRNLDKALHRAANPTTANPRAARRVSADASLAKSQDRAKALIDRIGQSYWTGQTGIVREGGGVEIPAKVLKRQDDGLLLVRLDFGANGKQDKSVNPDHFIRPNLLNDEE